jgi:hypothetical protein
VALEGIKGVRAEGAGLVRNVDKGLHRIPTK